MNFRVFALLAILLANPCFGQADPITLAVIIDTSDPLDVQYVSEEYVKNVKISALVGLVGGAVHATAIAKKNKAYEVRLRTAVGSATNLDQDLQLSLTQAISSHTSNIVLSFHSTDFMKKKKPDFAQFDAGAISHILVIREKKGLVTPSSNLGAVAAHSTLTLQLYDTKTKKRILKEKIQGLGPQTKDIDTALDSPDFFLQGYPQAMQPLGLAFYWRLNGRNALHQIAKNTPYAPEFPSIETLMKDYAKRFKFDRPKLRGWRTPRTGTPYLYRAEPKKDKNQFGIVSDVDLLLEELGQSFDEIQPYIALRVERLGDLGFDTSAMSEIPVLNFDDEWIGFSLPEPRGGTSIFIHKKINEYVVTHQIIVLDEDPLPLLEKYKVDVERYVLDTELALK